MAFAWLQNCLVSKQQNQTFRGNPDLCRGLYAFLYLRSWPCISTAVYWTSKVSLEMPSRKDVDHKCLCLPLAACPAINVNKTTVNTNTASANFTSCCAQLSARNFRKIKINCLALDMHRVQCNITAALAQHVVCFARAISRRNLDICFVVGCTILSTDKKKIL